MQGPAVRASFDGALALFALTMGLSAALLFAIQPMYAKMLLPLLGGAPAVWSVVVVFFQVALLAGYLFAHVLRSVALRLQPFIYIGLALLAITLLPFRVSTASGDAVVHPVPFTLETLLFGAGLPFLVISATSPLLQSWFVRIGHKHSKDPYFLYAASNAGSLLGLAMYPLVLEPLFGVTLQTRIWMVSYVILIACLCACAAVTWRFKNASAESKMAAETNDVQRITASQRLRWVALAFVPASLSLAMTTRITSDVAPIPLLWTLPLAVYLVTFIIAFSQRPILTPARVARVLPYAIFLVVFLALLSAALPAELDLVLNLNALFLIGISCHGELSASRPHARYLTEFYVLLSIGGALAGCFNGLVAPNAFRTVAEYPLTIVFACAILPTLGKIGRTPKDWIADLAWPALLGCALLLLFRLTERSSAVSLVMQIGFALAMVVCLAFVGRRIRLASAIAVLFLVAGLLPTRLGYDPGVTRDLYTRLDAERDFFGTKLVIRNKRNWHELIHGGTVHGLENMTPSEQTKPLSYYSHDGPLSTVFDAARAGRERTRNVAVVGLGVGTVACYERPGEKWSFIEIDPEVVWIARNDELFSYLSSCAPKAAITVGDGRLELTKVRPGSYDLLLLDAYSSDQPPVHMLTREAFALYARDVRRNGLIAFHISNRYFNLAAVLANLAAEAGWRAWIDNDLALTPRRIREGESASQWIVMARNARDAGHIAAAREWHPLAANAKLRVWTDDYSSLLLIIHA